MACGYLESESAVFPMVGRRLGSPAIPPCRFTGRGSFALIEFPFLLSYGEEARRRTPRVHRAFDAPSGADNA
jgi:hypothetical protein